MKKALCLIIATLLVMTIYIGFPNNTSNIVVADSRTSKTINVVFDDSGSMYENGETRWCKAKYALEVFSSMMGPNDRMNVFCMNGPEVHVDVSNYSDRVNVIHNMNSEYGDTPFSSIARAGDPLIEMGGETTERWLVVLTDGEMYREDYEIVSQEDLQDELVYYADNGINTVYLCIGYDAVVLNSQPERNFYTEHAVESVDILSSVTRIANQIFDHQVISSSFIDVKLLSEKGDFSIILTCRTKYVPKDNYFQKYEISPLTRELSLSFTQRYFDALNISISAVEFFNKLPKEVLSLTSSPLVLSMLIVQYCRTKTIPDNLDSLYAMITSQLLSNKPIIKNPLFPVAEKTYVLCYLAFNILISGRLSFVYDNAVSLISERNTYNIPSSDILDEFIHSGIVNCHDNRLSFFHTSILEFLSRQEISKKYSFEAKASMDQYFLRNADKINRIVRCVNPSRDDEIMEVGAGIGTVSLRLPCYKKLYLVDLDEGLCKILRYNFRKKENCEVICDDALKMLRELHCKKIISNLPFFMTKDVLNVLNDLDFRVAVLSVKQDDDLSEYLNVFEIDEVGVLDSIDFFPVQPFKSRLIKVTRKRNSNL